MKLLLTISIIVMALAITPKIQADELTGYYKIAIIDNEVEISSNGDESRDETEGSLGRGKVYLTKSGKLRFSGWVENWESEDGLIVRERISLRGVVNPTTGRIRITKVGGESVKILALEEDFTLKLKIIKRNGIVVGVNGSGSTREVDPDGTIDKEEYDITGYKTRNLP